MDDVTRIVPIESFFDAIGESESIENSFLCAETLINLKFQPKPSWLLFSTLNNAYVRLSTGIKPAVLNKAHNQVIGELTDGINPIVSGRQVLENEVIVFAGKGRFQKDEVSRIGKSQYEFKSSIVLDPLPQTASASEIFHS